eukprot:scaffold16219_cov102-Isochrysis_galbana.AAC.22
MPDGEGPWTDAGPVEAQIQELERQIEHLVRSNLEMREYLAETPDADLRAAIGENIVRKVTIARRRAIIEDLCKLMPNRSVASAVQLSQSDAMDTSGGDVRDGVHL